MKEIAAETMRNAIQAELDRERAEYGGMLPPWRPEVWLSLGLEVGVRLCTEAIKEGHGEYDKPGDTGSI